MLLKYKFTYGLEVEEAVVCDLYILAANISTTIFLWRKVDSLAKIEKLSSFQIVYLCRWEHDDPITNIKAM